MTLLELVPYVCAGIGGASLSTFVRAVRGMTQQEKVPAAPVTHNDTTAFMTCHLCRRENTWSLPLVDKLVTIMTEAELVSWCDSNIRCGMLYTIYLDSTPPRVEIQKDSKDDGCRASMAAVVLEHPYVAELYERKHVAEARREEVFRTAGVVEKPVKTNKK